MYICVLISTSAPYMLLSTSHHKLLNTGTCLLQAHCQLAGHPYRHNRMLQRCAVQSLLIHGHEHMGRHGTLRFLADLANDVACMDGCLSPDACDLQLLHCCFGGGICGGLQSGGLDLSCCSSGPAQLDSLVSLQRVGVRGCCGSGWSGFTAGEPTGAGCLC